MTDSSDKPFRRGLLAIAGGLAVAAIFAFEHRAPLRRQRHPPAPRDRTNVAMGALCAVVVAYVETPVTMAIARRNATKRRGLAQRMPGALGPVAGFLAMDYGFYLWHVATHRVDALWRLHRVHHVDPDMDMSTAIRFHMLDMLVSLPWRMAQVRISGVGPGTLTAWHRFSTLSILFHHSNWNLPPGWDRRLSMLLTTPRMHGVHHSVVPRERDSNWSSGISIWDRLHGTLRFAPQDRIVIGVDDPSAMDDIALEPALRSPFREDPTAKRGVRA